MVAPLWQNQFEKKNFFEKVFVFLQKIHYLQKKNAFV